MLYACMKKAQWNILVYIINMSWYKSNNINTLNLYPIEVAGIIQ
jgi:hypothetical protein